jgi:hypothetical protein
MLNNYELRLHDAYGSYKFNIEDVISLEYSRKANNLGIATVTIYGTRYEPYDFNRDDRLEIYRLNNKKSKVLIGDTCWFLRKQEVQIDSDCNVTIVLTFYDTIHLLTRRVVAWAGRLDVGYVSHLLQNYDSMLYLIMYFNYGNGTTSEILNANALVPNVPAQNLTSLNGNLISTIRSWQTLVYNSDLTNRRLPITLPIPPNQSTLSGTQRFENITVLQAMQEIANVSNLKGEKLYFDIIYTPASPFSTAQFEFRTWVNIRGLDRTFGFNRIVVGPQYGNLTDTSILRDWETEATIAYMAGNGQDENKIYASAKSSVVVDSPFYPIEIFGSENFGDEVTGLQNPPEGISAAQVLLAENAAIETLTGTIINNDKLDFFTNVNPYDLIIAEYKGFKQLVALDEYNVTVDESSEEISIPLG